MTETKYKNGASVKDPLKKTQIKIHLVAGRKTYKNVEKMKTDKSCFGKVDKVTIQF